MKCSGCGQEFPNLTKLKKHKPDCPANQDAVKPEIKKPIIALDLCPEEVKLYSIGHSVGLRVTGVLTPKGIEVQEVTLIR